MAGDGGARRRPGRRRPLADSCSSSSSASPPPRSPGASATVGLQPRPPRLRSLALTLGLALVPAADGAGVDPYWWRLKCNSTTADQWRLCHLGFFADATCTRAPIAQLQQRVHSPGTVTHGVPVDAVVTEFASDCQQCARGEAYVGVRFSTPVVIQCVRFTECWNGAAPTPPPPGPPPAPGPGPAQAVVATTTTLASGGGVQVSTTDWHSLFSQLGGGGRRLGASSCTSLMLERSADAFDWSFVAEWSSPRPDVSLNLAMAEKRPPPSPPYVVSWNPAAVSCNDCTRPNVDSVQANHVLEVTFSDQIHWGGGNVVIERGGLTNTPLDPVLDSRWFQVRGSRLRIIPPPEVPLGASSSCSLVRFSSEALQNADGEFLSPGTPYSICIADTVPPTLMRTDPLDGSRNQGLLPRILLEFNEEVAVHLNPAPVQLVPIGSSTAQTLTIQMGDTSKVRITSCGYCALAGMVELLVLSPLEPETEYELRIPSTSIADASGNAWPGTVLSFTTQCPASGCASTPAPTPAPVASDNKDEEESQNIPLYLGIVGGVACCGAGLLAAWKYYVRHYLLPKRHGAKEHTGWTVPSAPTPAWTAKSGSVTTGWRKPQSNNGNAGPGGPGPMGGVTVGSPTSNSGSFGFGASRVTASVPPAGPRAAAVPVKEEARQPPRASAQPGSVPAKQPPAQPPTAPDKKRAQTDEDLKRNTTTSPSSSTFAAAGKQGSFADDSAVSGGWVRAVDAASGRTYWYHYKTRETRWDEPTRSGQHQGPPTPPRAKPRAAPEASPQPGSAAGPEAKASGGGASPQGARRGQSKPESAKAPPVAAKAPDPPPENKAGRVKADVLEQLEKTKKEDIASRKKTFRFLCLQWHPDKNQEDSELATEVFQFMQLQRDWYLKE